jgi:hypothetical protein
MRVVQQLDEAVWRRFVEQNPKGRLFHTPEMFQVFERTAGHRPELWAVLNHQSDVLALMLPVNVTLMNGVFKRLTTRSVVYGGVLYQDGDHKREALTLLLDSYGRSARGRSLFTELRHVCDASDVQPILDTRGYVHEGHLNYLIRLDRAPEEVLQGIGPRTRKKIRKALRDGHVQVSDVSTRAELARWYDVLQKTYDNAHVPLAGRSLFEAAFDILRPKGMAKFLMATVHDVPAACSVELPYKNGIYGWYGGCDREYGAYLPNEVLIWHILEWGAQNGYGLYDFGGAGKPDEEYGVRDFKAKFGGELVNYGRSTCTHSPGLLALSKRGYELYRRLAA